MKILMLGWELPPHNSGGLGVACYQLCKELSTKNVDIEFILPYEAQHNASFMTIKTAFPSDEVNLIKKVGAYDSYLYSYIDGKTETISIFDQHEKYAQGVDTLTKYREYDIIHAHDWLTFRGAIKAKLNTKKPLIVHIHATEFDRAGGKPGNPLVEEIEYTGMMLADRIIAVSQATKNLITDRYHIDPEKIDVVHNNIDPSYYQSVDSENDYKYLSAMKENGYKIVSNIGRLTAQKGLYNYLIAAKEVVKREPKTIFLVVGSGEQLYELIEHSAGLGIAKNVIFVDFQRGKRWRDAFKISDLFVLPSVSEPFGLTPLEAIHFGVPVLVTKQSGVSEILHHCLKVDFWDVNQMANQILAVLRNNSLQQELRKNASKDINGAGWGASANKIINIYTANAGTCS